jgi:hypothetical protein
MKFAISAARKKNILTLKKNIKEAEPEKRRAKD